MNNRIKKLICDNPLKKLIAIYILFLGIYAVIHLGYGIINLYGYSTGKYIERNLALEDFEIIDGEISDYMTLVNKSNDTQLIYTGDIRNLTVKCTFSENPGEFICFYNNSADYVFGTHKMEYTKIYDGYYVFEFPLGTKQIRMDTGIFSTTTTIFEEIILNKQSVPNVLNVKAGDLFTLLVLPGVFFMVIETMQNVIKKLKIRKK